MVHKVRKHQCSVGQDNPFPHLAVNVMLNAPQEMVGLSACLSTLLTHVQITVDQDPFQQGCSLASYLPTCTYSHCCA